MAIALRACLATWAASEKKIVPREFQLEATIAIMSGKDALIDVGTGYGKTLCMIIPCLLDSPGSISILISISAKDFGCVGIKIQINVAQIPATRRDAVIWLEHVRFCSG